MSPATIIILIIILIAAVFAGRRMVGAWTGKGGCHGGGGASGKVKKVKVTDTNEANYPYTFDLKVSGMSCEDCVKNVENALNALGDTWATVDLKSGNAHIRSKKPIDESAAKQAVVQAGYYIRQF